MADELTDIEKAIKEEETQSQLEEFTEDAKKEDEASQAKYEDPISEEYQRDMENWMGMNARKKRNDRR